MALKLSKISNNERAIAAKQYMHLGKLAELLFNRNHRQLYMATPTYGERVWTGGRLNLSETPEFQFERPVGLVLGGALEVTEKFGVTPFHRVRTTKILRPGEFFGLFESIGRLRGQWEITSGVQQFLIFNRLGDKKFLSKAGWQWISDDQLATLKHNTKAKYDYAELLNFVFKPNGTGLKGDSDPWKSSILVFDLKGFTDNEALIFLYQATVDQFASLARQNPPDAMYENQPEVRVGAEAQRVAAGIDAILSDDVPIFALYNEHHRAFGPFDQVKAAIEMLQDNGRNIGNSTADTHLWIPDYWSKVTSPGGLYIDALSGRFSMERATTMLRNTSTRSLPSGTRIESLTRGDSWSARAITRDGASAVIQGLKQGCAGSPLADGLARALFPNGAQTYTWPPHLSDAFFLQRVV